MRQQIGKAVCFLLWTNAVLGSVFSVPVGGNSWTSSPTASIDNNGFNWNQYPDASFLIYIYARAKGLVKVSLSIKYQQKVNLQVTMGSTVINAISSAQPATENITIGYFDIQSISYVAFSVSVTLVANLASNTPPTDNGLIDYFYLQATSQITFSPISSDAYPQYRSGPIISLAYDIEHAQSTNYYASILIQPGTDAWGTIHAPIAFDSGVLGVRVDENGYKYVSLSVQDMVGSGGVFVNGNGENITEGGFILAGTGKTVQLQYDWAVNVTYNFLLSCKQNYPRRSTSYEAYFFDPVANNWRYIAELERPGEVKFLKGFSGLISPNLPTAGNINRITLFPDAWFQRKQDAKWIQIVSAKVQGQTRNRLDFNAGLDQNRFFIKTCGFINQYILLGTTVTKTAKGTEPSYDLLNVIA